MTAHHRLSRGSAHVTYGSALWLVLVAVAFQLLAAGTVWFVRNRASKKGSGDMEMSGTKGGWFARSQAKNPFADSSGGMGGRSWKSLWLKKSEW